VKGGAKLKEAKDGKQDQDEEKTKSPWDGLPLDQLDLCDVCREHPKCMVWLGCGHCSLCHICGHRYL
jgi:hypothetical protein